MKKFIKTLILLIVMNIVCVSAFAEALELNGKVTATQTETLSAPASGKITSVNVIPGDHIDAGAVLAEIQTSKVYAEQDGVIRVFGHPGDSVETLTARYGGVAYLEPKQRYTVSGSTKSAFSIEENKQIHAGETVYLQSSNDSKLIASGIVTVVSGNSYTVEVNDSTFTSDTTVNIYRGPDCYYRNKIGSGKVSMSSAIVYSGSGYLVRLHVQNGQQVSAGDLLYETLEGSFVPGSEDIDKVLSSAAGVIASVNVNKGKTVSADEELLTFYPDDGMRIVVSVPESDLSHIEVNMPVQYALPYDEENAQWLNGSVEKVSRIAEEEAYSASYQVYIIPESNSVLCYGMTVYVLIP